MGEDRRHRPTGDDEVGPLHARPGELLVDHHLGDRVGAQPVRRRPVRGEVAGVGQPRPSPVVGRGGDLGHPRPDLRAQRLVPAVQVERDLTAYAVDGPGREPRGGRICVGEQAAQRQRTPQVEVGVVLEREADPAQDLDAGLGDLDRPVEAHRFGDVGGEGPLLVVRRRRRGVRDVPRRGGDRLDGLQHLGAEVLHRLEAADRPAELLAHLRVLDRRLQAPPGDPRGLGRTERHGRTTDQRAGQPVDPERPLGARRVDRPERTEPAAQVQAGDRREVDGVPRHDVPGVLLVGHQDVGGAGSVPDRVPGQGDADDRAVRDRLPDRGPTQQRGGDRGPEQRPRQQLVGAGLERDRHVEGRATAARRVGQPDRDDTHLTDGLPDIGERLVGLTLRGPHGCDRGQARGPPAQARRQLDVLVGDPERHGLPLRGLDRRDHRSD